MAQLHETKLRRIKFKNRRGVWTTWGAPGTWSACLIKSEGDLVADLESCPSVKSVSDVTADVDSETLPALNRQTSLLVLSPHQPWATFAEGGGYNDLHDALEREFPGEVLRTGAVDDNGIVYVWLSRNGQRILDFRTDGMGWPVPPEDADYVDDELGTGDIFIFETDLYPADWPHTLPRVEAAHQQLIIDLDAYIPHLTFNGQLAAEYGHADACQRQHIDRVLQVEFEA